MIDWITLGVLVVIVGTLAGVIVPMITSLKTEMREEFRDMRKAISDLEGKVDRNQEAIWVEFSALSRRLPAEPELALYPQRRRVRQAS